ncbi:MAG: hypothetical protein M1820_010209 [Bogoriella megaspora]|nr:MAG: hypothetical protein M1820_010209 [Bogoriella megaspora]
MPMPTDLNSIPVSSPPAGVNPFPLYKGESLATTTLVLFCILGSTATVTVLIRLLASYKARGSASGGIGAADVCSIAALIISIGQESVVLTFHKTQRHGWDVPLAALTPSYFKRLFAQNLLAWPAITLSKLAILLLYLRIFKVRPSMRYAIYAGIAWIFATYLPSMVVAIYFCGAHSGEPWSYPVGERCAEHGPTKWFVTSAAMSIILDLYILVLPISVVRRLNMSRKRRVGVLLIFFTAFFACICAILTLVYRIKLLTTNDTLWRSSELFICNLVENFVAIIVGALPGCSSYLRPYVAESAMFSRLLSNFSSSFSKLARTGGSSKGTYRLHETSREDTESQRSLHNAVGLRDIKVQTDYQVDSQQRQAPHNLGIYPGMSNVQPR